MAELDDAFLSHSDDSNYADDPNWKAKQTIYPELFTPSAFAAIKRIEARRSCNAKMVRLYIEIQRAQENVIRLSKMMNGIIIPIQILNGSRIAEMKSAEDTVQWLRKYELQRELWKVLKKHARLVGKMACALRMWYEQITTTCPNGQMYIAAAKRFKSMAGQVEPCFENVL